MLQPPHPEAFESTPEAALINAPGEKKLFPPKAGQTRGLEGPPKWQRGVPGLWFASGAAGRQRGVKPEHPGLILQHGWVRGRRRDGNFLNGVWTSKAAEAGKE